jgi:hypothetical protein
MDRFPGTFGAGLIFAFALKMALFESEEPGYLEF